MKRIILAFACVVLYNDSIFSQQYSITHEGEISGGWMYDPRSNQYDYTVLFPGTEYVAGTAEDEIAQLFINWQLFGGIVLKAGNGTLENFYIEYVNDKAYNEFMAKNIEYVKEKGEYLKQIDFYKSKYPDGIPDDMVETKINGNRAVYYSKQEADESAETTTKSYKYFIFLNDNNGVIISGGLKYIKDKSTLSLAQYEQLMAQHIQELRFQAEEVPGTSTENNAETIPPPESDLPWTIIIGSISAVAVAAILRKLLRKQGTKTNNESKEEPKEKEVAHYILQLNKDSIPLKLNEPGQLDIQVWKISKEGKFKIDAAIEIQNPEKHLHIQSQYTGGRLLANLTLEKAPTTPVFNVLVLATTEGKSIQKTVEIKMAGKMEIVLEMFPNNKRALRPDTKQVLTCHAKIIDADGKVMPEETKKIKFKPNSDWIDLSTPVMDRESIAINIGASSPNQVSPATAVPKQVSLSVIMDDVMKNEEVLQTDLTIELLDCKLETDISTCSFPVSDQQTEIKFKAFIDNCNADEPWIFEGEYRKHDKPDEALSQINIVKKSGQEVAITLTGPIMKPGPHETNLSKTLVISAHQANEKPLERHLLVMVTQVGLFIKNGVDASNQVTYMADGPFEKNIEFVLYKYDKKTNEIFVDKEGLKHLEIKLKNEEKDIVNFASVLKVNCAFDDLVGNIPYGRFKLQSTEQVPGFGDVFTLDYLVQAPYDPDENPEQFQQEFHLKVKTYGIGSEFPEWVEAYNKCKIVINEYVPAGDPRTRLSELLESRKYTLGAEGLNELRKRLWKVAYNLILAEGDQGYKSQERWANGITTTLEWTEWAGDLAFNALAAYYLKGIGAVGASLIKGAMIEALNFYIYENKPIDEFIDRQYEKIIPFLVNVAKGRLISVENIELVVRNNKPLAMAIFISCEFLYNLYQTKSVVEAAKLTGGQIMDEIIIRKLTLQLHKNQLKYNIKMVSVAESLEDVVKSVKTKDGVDYIELSKVMEIMRDPAKVRTIKNHAPEWLKKVFDDSRTKIYQKHDADLKKFISDKYNIDENDVKIDDFRTPGSGDGFNLNTDRDYRVLRKVKASDGSEIWIELQRPNWIEHSYETFGKLTDKPYGISPKEWAEKHLQRATDRFDAEASKDYADHLYDSTTGKVIKDQPNIVKVKKGDGTLYDAEGLGKMYQNKVVNALEPGTLPEAYAQSKKGVETLKEVHESYTKQNLPVPEIPEKLKKAMEIIDKAHTDVQATPEAVNELNKQLIDLKYNNLADVAKDLADEFKKLKQFDQPSDIYKVS
ncbi:MAG: hypothetical protein WAT91_15995 [Saprospiraceae bacterium]